jgi:hypothetical protein
MAASTDPRRALALGALAGVGAGFVFATAHALLIVPIWNRMLGGLAFGSAAGAVGAWTFTVLYPEYASARLPARLAAGTRYGALLWLAVAPVSLIDAALRASGVLPRFEMLGVIIALAIATGMGVAFGWIRTKTRRGMLAGAAATLFLTFAMAGPVPIGRSQRALGIFLAVLPAAILAGMIVGAVGFPGSRTVRTSKVSGGEDSGVRSQN